METYSLWMNVAEGIFVVLGVGYLYASKSLGGETPPFATLVGRLCLGALFICLGSEGLLPILFSPRVAITGQVSGLHRAHAGRGHYDFEFVVAGRGSRRRIRADYSDPGFYSGDPIISEGDTVEATYLKLNGQTVEVRELVGRHAGWEYEADTKPIALPLLILIGLAFVIVAIAGFITDVQAKPDNDSEGVKPISVLGL